MEILLMHLSQFILPAAQAAHQVESTTGSVVQDKIGFVVLGIIIGPVALLTAASMIGAPRNSRIPFLFIGALVTLITGMAASLGVIGWALKFIVPQ